MSLGNRRRPASKYSLLDGMTPIEASYARAQEGCNCGEFALDVEALPLSDEDEGGGGGGSCCC